jgi:predicted aspartyl protease
VNGRPLRVTLDTGSSLVLSVYASAAERLGLDSLRANAREETVRGFRGEASILVATVDSIGLGPLVVRDAEVSFPERDGTTDGNLGNGYLQNFILTVDYLSERVTLERP